MIGRFVPWFRDWMSSLLYINDEFPNFHIYVYVETPITGSKETHVTYFFPETSLNDAAINNHLTEIMNSRQGKSHNSEETPF